MSDDDRDIDIESDCSIGDYQNFGNNQDDNDSDTGGTLNGRGQSGSQNFTQAEKRAHHNALERKRRDHIKESFTALREAVPSLKGEKASRAQILKKTTECIQTMRQKIQSNQKDVADIKKQNAILEAQIRMLENAKNGGPIDPTEYNQLTQAEQYSQNDDSSDIEDEEQDFSRRSKKMKTSYTA